MPFTSVLMGQGSFELQLRADTPYSIRTSLDDHGTVVITPTDIVDPGITRATLLTLARFSGIKRRGEDNMTRLSGPSITAWLGDDDGKGSWQAGTRTGPHLWATVVTNLFFLGTYVNGLTLGSFYSAAASLVYDSYSGEESVRDFMDRAGRAVDMEWIVRPDGVVDSGSAGSALFRQTPTVVFTRDVEGVDHHYQALRARNLNLTAHAEQYATDVANAGNGASGSSSTIFTRPQHFSGANDAYIQKLVTSDLTDNTACTNQAASDLLYVYKNRNETPSLEVDVFDIGRYLVPGDNVYAFDPWSGLVNTANQVEVLGQTMFPVTLRAWSTTSPIRAGMGVWFVNNADGTNAVTRLSDWVEWETGPARVDVGDRPPTIRNVVTGWN